MLSVVSTVLVSPTAKHAVVMTLQSVCFVLVLPMTMLLWKCADLMTLSVAWTVLVSQMAPKLAVVKTRPRV
jgi:hypothetical protein